MLSTEKGMKTISSNSFNPNWPGADTGWVHVCLLGTLKGAHSVILITSALVKMDLIFSLLKKSWNWSHYGTSHNFISFLVDTSLAVLASLLTNVKYFMTSDTVQKISLHSLLTLDSLDLPWIWVPLSAYKVGHLERGPASSGQLYGAQILICPIHLCSECENRKQSLGGCGSQPLTTFVVFVLNLEENW